MAKLNITPEDLLKGKLVAPGWYPALIKNVEEKPSKGDGSTNWNLEFKILEGTEFSGVPVYRTFNEKGAGFAQNFVLACGGKFEKGKSFELDFHKTVGTKLKIYITNALYEGKMKNQVEDFQPA
jgi:hypothetical protein